MHSNAHIFKKKNTKLLLITDYMTEIQGSKVELQRPIYHLDKYSHRHISRKNESNGLSSCSMPGRV